MRTLTHTLYYPSRSDTFRLYHLTDLHIGHVACDERMLQKDIDRIAGDPNAYWIGGGDYIDAISRRGDPRYTETSLAPWLRLQSDPVGRQVHRFVDMVAPIAHKCLGLGIGNHESKVLDKADRDVYLEICRGVAGAAGKKIHDLAYGWEAFIKLRFRRGTPENFGGVKTITIYTHHGSGGGRKQGGHAIRMEETLLTYDCDVALMGHRHIQQVVKKVTISPSGKGIKYRERIGVWCGSYLKSHVDDTADGYPVGTYPQEKHLSPTPIGTVPLIIKPDIAQIIPIMSNGLGVDILDQFVPPTNEPATLLKLAKNGREKAAA
jgi:hypothetical protein